MDMIRHKNECVEFVAAFGAILPKKIEQQIRIGVDLKNPPAVCSYSSRKEGPEFLRSEKHWLEA